MVLLPNNQDLSAASGIINIAYLEGIYHSFMDEAMFKLSGSRFAIFHLPPIQEQDNTTQASPAPQQYNPFFSRVPVPANVTRNPGTKLTPRDVQYNAQIVVGPIKDDSKNGIGRLDVNEAMITVVIEALQHVNEALSVSIEGRRYTRVGDPRPIGFSQRRYLMVKLRAIQETENPSPDITVG
jgi:hypothetical protein